MLVMHAASAGDRAEGRSLGPNDVSMGVARWDFESLYAATHSDMVRLAYLLTGSLAQAEEVTQDSFVRLYEQWAEVANHPAYLRASVVNGCRSWHRSRFAAIRRESRLARPDGHHDRPDEIIDALAKLPRRRREVIVLRFYQGSHWQTSPACSGSRKDRNSTLYHGLNELREAIDE